MGKKGNFHRNKKTPIEKIFREVVKREMTTNERQVLLKKRQRPPQSK